MEFDVKGWLAKVRAQKQDIEELIEEVGNLISSANFEILNLGAQGQQGIVEFAKDLIEAGLSEGSAAVVVQTYINQTQVTRREQSADLTKVLSSAIGPVLSFLLPIIPRELNLESLFGGRAGEGE